MIEWGKLLFLIPFFSFNYKKILGEGGCWWFVFFGRREIISEFERVKLEGRMKGRGGVCFGGKKRDSFFSSSSSFFLLNKGSVIPFACRCNHSTHHISSLVVDPI